MAISALKVGMRKIIPKPRVDALKMPIAPPSFAAWYVHKITKLKICVMNEEIISDHVLYMVGKYDIMLKKQMSSI
jgi:hypothetical protein